MKKRADVAAWVEKAEQDYEGAETLSRRVPEIELIADLIVFLNEFSVQYRYPGEKATLVYAKRALKAVREVRKFFALRLPGISRN